MKETSENRGADTFTSPWREISREMVNAFFDGCSGPSSAQGSGSSYNDDDMSPFGHPGNAAQYWDMLPDMFKDAIGRAVHNWTRAYHSRIQHACALAEDWTARPVIWADPESGLEIKGRDKGRPAVLMVPSVINPPWILDIQSGDGGFASFLESQGFDVFILSWGTYGVSQRGGSGWHDYAENYLPAAAKALHTQIGRRLHVMGYCLGGTLLNAALHHTPALRDYCASVSLFAAPWDFARTGDLRARVAALKPFWHSWLESGAGVPASWISALMISLDPGHWLQKWMHADLEGDADGTLFLDVEAWAASGAALPVPLARNILEDMYENAGSLLPEARTNVDLPLALVVPQKDYLVPENVARPAGESYARHFDITPDTGHIGLMVSRKARAELWQPWVEWLRAREVTLPAHKNAA